MSRLICYLYFQEQQSIPVVASAIKDRLIVAAIDFGTTYSGYAYSFYHDFREDPLRITTNYWDRTTSVCWFSLFIHEHYNVSELLHMFISYLQ